MRQLCIVICLLAGPGCTMTDADKSQLDSALKDARGENMKMRGDTSRLSDSGDMPSLRPSN
jgi:hypothetical protein